MDDKNELAILMTRIAASMEAIDNSVNDIAAALQAMRKQAEDELKAKMSQLDAITKAPTQPPLVSGRWHRRDGDGFVKTSPPPEKPFIGTGIEAKFDGDGKAGYIRPPDQR